MFREKNQKTSVSEIRFRHNPFVIFPSLLLFLFALSCMTGEAKEEASVKTTDANGVEIIEQDPFVREFSGLPPSEQLKTIENLGLSSQEADLGKIGTLLNSRFIQGNPQLKKAIVGALTNNGGEQATELLDQAVVARKISLDDRLIDYFRERRYRPIVPSVIAHVEAGYNPDKGMSVIADIGGKTAEEYIQSVAGDSEHPASASAKKALSRLKKEEGSKRFILYTLASAASASHPGLDQAIESSVKNGYDPEVWNLMDRVRVTTEDPQLKGKIVDAMVRIKPEIARFAEAEKKIPLAYTQAGMSLWRSDKFRPMQPPEKPEFSAEFGTEETLEVPGEAKPEKTGEIAATIVTPEISPQGVPEVEKLPELPSVKKKAAVPQKKKIRPGKSAGASRVKAKRPPVGKKFSSHWKLSKAYRTSQQYKDAVYSSLVEVMGVERGKSLFYRMNNAMIAYSKDTSLSKDFFIRAYRREFRISEKKAVEYLGKGLSQRGSLGAIVKNVIKEYEGRKMQIYALASYLDIPRWQSELLIELVIQKRF